MKKIIPILFSAVLCFGLLPAHSAYSEETTKNHTLCTVLTEAETGTVIKSQNENIHMPADSLCKLMTVLLTAEEIQSGNLSPDTPLTASAEASAQSGAVVWLMQGESITVDELLKSVIVGNANDASMVLAEHIGETEDAFVDMMNARAFELGMRDTVYKSCNGNCSAENINNQYTTAYDTAVIAKELLKHKSLRKYFTTWTDKVRNGQTELVNENRLVRTYDGITGMKACHSEQSGFNLVLTAEKNNSSFISVVLGCDDKDERFTLGKSLLSTGFSSYKITSPMFSNEFLKPVEVRGGTDNAVMIQAGNLRELVIPKNSGDLSTSVLLPQYLDAPVVKGQTVGKVGFYNGDTLLFETDLIASESIQKIDFALAIKKYLCIMYK